MNTPTSLPQTLTADIGGDVGGNVVVGNYNLVLGSVHGGVVNVTTPEKKPNLTRRPAPASILPRRFSGLLDRQVEVGVAASALPDAIPLEFYARPGQGKTALLRVLARHSLTAAFPDGVMYLSAHRQPADDLLQSLFDTLYETDVPFKPDVAQLSQLLQDVQALVVLDDVELERDELERLMNAAPACTFLLASLGRQLWGEGRAVALAGLPEEAALALLERELGRPLEDEECTPAQALCQALGGHPLHILQAAGLVREAGRSLLDLANEAHQTTDGHPLATGLLASLSAAEKQALSAIAALDGEPLGEAHLTAVAGLPEAASVVDALLRRSLIQAHSPRYTLAGDLDLVVASAWDLAPWRERLLAYFRSWVEIHHGDTARLLEEAGPLTRLVAWASGTGRWVDVLRLTWRLEEALALDGRWAAWEQLLQHALRAAQALGNQAALAWVLHQLGTRLLCLEQPGPARQLLVRALRLRQSLGDRPGAAITRHNLRLLIGPPTPPEDTPPRQPPPRRFGPPRFDPGLLLGVAVAFLFTFATAALILALAWLLLLPPTTNPEPTIAAILPSLVAPSPFPTVTPQTPAPTLIPTATLASAPPLPTSTQPASPAEPDTATRKPTKISCTPVRNWPVYVVRRGDTLSSLARLTGTTYQQIMAANCLNTTILRVGQRLRLPNLDWLEAVTETPTPTQVLLPNLLVSGFSAGNVSGGFTVPIQVAVQNQGRAQAGNFAVAIHYKAVKGNPPAEGVIAFQVPGQESAGTPLSGKALSPGETLGFAGRVTFGQEFNGQELFVWAEADTCYGNTGLPKYCRVLESDEMDNSSRPWEVNLAPLATPQVTITLPDADLSLPYNGYNDQLGLWYTDLRLEGSAVDWRGQAIPAESLRWSSDRQADGLGSGAHVDARLYSETCSGVAHTITLEATDSGDQVGTASRTISLYAESCAPQVRIVYPKPDERIPIQGYDRKLGLWYTDLDLAGEAVDARGHPLDGDALVWSSDGRADIQRNGSNANARLYSDTCTGASHRLTLSARDAEGNQNEATLDLTLYSKDCSPRVQILSPKDGEKIPYTGYDDNRQRWYLDLTLEGSATDARGQALDGDALVWSSDGQADIPANGAKVDARLYSNTCSGVWHTIQLVATDQDGFTASMSIRIFIYNKYC